jgi:hypothetical protein
LSFRVKQSKIFDSQLNNQRRYIHNDAHHL